MEKCGSLYRCSPTLEGSLVRKQWWANIGMGMICVPLALWIVQNSLANCAKPRVAPPVSAPRTPESSASSSSNRRKESQSEERRERRKAPPKATRVQKESNAPIPQAPKKEPAPEERKQPTPPAKKEEEKSEPKEEKKAEPLPAQSVKTVKKEAVKVPGIADFVDQAKTTKAPLLVLKQGEEEEDPGDGNYEDVNLTEAVAPEANVQLVTVDPPSATFPLTGGQSAHNIQNVGENRIVFKVKCSNNNEYGIRPVFGFVEPASSTMLLVTRLAGKPKEDKMVIEYVLAPAEAKDPMVAFRAAATTVQSITVPLVAVGPTPGAPGAAVAKQPVPAPMAAVKPPMPVPVVPLRPANIPVSPAPAAPVVLGSAKPPALPAALVLPGALAPAAPVRPVAAAPAAPARPAAPPPPAVPGPPAPARPGAPAPAVPPAPFRPPPLGTAPPPVKPPAPGVLIPPRPPPPSLPTQPGFAATAPIGLKK